MRAVVSGIVLFLRTFKVCVVEVGLIGAAAKGLACFIRSRCRLFGFETRFFEVRTTPPVERCVD